MQVGPTFKLYIGTNVTGFRSHIETEAGSEVKAFDVIFDDATGLSDMSDRSDLSDQSEAIYNLAGQRLQKMQKGVNIVNGKKIVK